jgi:hypothetical protein
MTLSKDDRWQKDADARRFGRRIDDRRGGYIHPFPVDRLLIISPSLLIVAASFPTTSLLITVAVISASVSTVMTIFAE